MGTVEIVCADVMEWAASYDGEPFHAALMDPPYGLEFMGKDWDRFQGYVADTGFKGFTLPRQRRRNIKCPECDKYVYDHAERACTCGGVARAQMVAYEQFCYDWTRAIMPHLLPGAWLMAFASSRGWHRLAVAVEDSGMIIQPSIFGWANGQSFPKASRIDTQIDKAAGKLAERETVVRPIAYPDSDCWGTPNRNVGSTIGTGACYGQYKSRPPGGVKVDTKAATPLACTWEGHRYGGQVLKDALNPIICAQKPWEGKRLDCIVETGAGALNVDGGRVGLQGIEAHNTPGRSQGHGSKIYFYPDDKNVNPVQVERREGGLNPRYDQKGRWPPNFYLQHSPLCQARGTRRVKGSAPQGQKGDWAGGDTSYCGGLKEKGVAQKYADADGLETVSLFACEIHCQACGHVWIAEDKEPCAECGGAGEWECAVRKLGEQSGKLRSGGKTGAVYTTERRGVVFPDLDKQTSPAISDVGTCSRFFKNPDWSLEVAETLAGADHVRYCAKSSRAERDAGLDELPEQGRAKIYGAGVNTDTKCDPKLHTPEGVLNRPKIRCNHPTMKPLSLNKWLATLLLPPPEYAPRRLLVPFGGVCSEAIGALLAGWEHITVIEMSEEYTAIGRARVKFWQGWSERTGLTEPKAILKAHKKAIKATAKAPAPQQVALQL